MAEFTRRHPIARVAAILMILKQQTAFGNATNSVASFGIIGTGERGRYVGSHLARDPTAIEQREVTWDES